MVFSSLTSSSASSTYSWTPSSSFVQAVEDPSGTMEATSPKPQVVEDPSGSPEVKVLSSSSGGMTPMDAKAFAALRVMRSYYDCDSVVTAERLVEAQEHYSIPREYELHIPLPGQHRYDDFLSGFGLSIDALEVGLWFPLHPIIKACLEGWRILPSQMVPNS
ncbi:hypothetical protein BHE74_00043610 [Ensete ventricosum]|nr:hypothetical protein BHE74_00043610 [Ensete ventricosum]